MYRGGGNRPRPLLLVSLVSFDHLRKQRNSTSFALSPINSSTFSEFFAYTVCILTKKPPWRDFHEGRGTIES
jgi:hypothetical protein